MKAFNFSGISAEPSKVYEGVNKGELRPRKTFYTFIGKRCFDLFLALLLLPLFVPIILVTWMLTRLDGGPGFYSQVRVGKDKRIFKCWKVRTMVMDAETILRELCESDPEIAAEWHLNQKLENDPRITKIGKFLRATSLDELPQLWNVIRGDMTFVGPRPFMTSQEAMYRTAGGASYFLMRPGITGSWQVFGRGETSFLDRIRFDDEYFETMSFKQDLKIIWKTVAVVIQHKGQ